MRWIPLLLLLFADVSRPRPRVRAEACGLIRTIPAPATTWISAEFSPDGRILALGTEEGEIHLLSTGSWKPLRRWKTPAAKITHLAFNPEGSRVVSCDGASEVFEWDPATGEQTHRFHHPGTLLTAGYSPDGTRLFTGGAFTLRSWDARTGESLAYIRQHVPGSRAVVFMRDGSRLVVPGGPGQLLELELASLGMKQTTSVSTQPIVAVVRPGREETLYCLSASGEVQRVLDGVGRVGQVEGGPVQEMRVSRDGKLLAVAAGDSLWLIDPDHPKPVRLTHHTGAISSVAIDPRRRFVATVAADSQLKIWGYRAAGMRGIRPKGYFGVSVVDDPAGVKVVEVVEGTAAAAAGIQTGDLVIELDGVQVRNTAHVISTIGMHSAGDAIRIRFRRDGADTSIEAVLGEWPER